MSSLVSSRARRSFFFSSRRRHTRSKSPKETTIRRSDEEGNVVGARRRRDPARLSGGRNLEGTRRNAEHDRVGGLLAARVGDAVREAEWLQDQPEVRRVV